MSAEEAMIHFVEPMRARFTVPTGLAPDRFSAEVAKSLANFDVHQLSAGAEHFRRTREQRTFPSEAECIRVCAGFATGAQVTAPKRRFVWKSPEEIKSEQIAEWQRKQDALKLCKCDLGAQAHTEGWLTSLVEWVTEHQRLPQEHEARKLRAFSREVDENLHRAPKPAGYKALCQIRDMMKRRAYRDVFGIDTEPEETGQTVTAEEMRAFGEENSRPRSAKPDFSKRGPETALQREERLARMREHCAEVSAQPFTVGEGLAKKIAGMVEETADGEA